MIVFILYHYEEHGAEHVFATTDRANVLPMVEEYFNQVLAHLYKEKDKENLIAKVNETLALSDRELMVEGRFDLMKGWGGPVLQVTKLFEAPASSAVRYLEFDVSRDMPWNEKVKRSQYGANVENAIRDLRTKAKKKRKKRWVMVIIDDDTPSFVKPTIIMRLADVVIYRHENRTDILKHWRID
jgi:hypothetical protein